MKEMSEWQIKVRLGVLNVKTLKQKHRLKVNRVILVIKC